MTNLMVVMVSPPSERVELMMQQEASSSLYLNFEMCPQQSVPLQA
jgi:hypothetical protein